MPNNDDIEHGSPPITPPGGDIGEQDMFEPEPTTTPNKWNWVGSPDSPAAQESSDGMSDLFEVDDDPDTDDLVSVDIEKDVIDGDLSDITDVSEEDILGDDLGQTDLDYKPTPSTGRVSRPSRLSRKYIPPTSLGGIGG